MIQALLARGEHLARIEGKRAALTFVNGLEWLLRDPSTVVGQTPYDVLHQEGLMQVRRYQLKGATRRHAIPVLLVPPLMVNAFIFDLYAGRSLARFLLERGYAVYLIDFGRPERTDALISLDRYVLDWLPAAADVVLKDAGANELSLLGYCMGGLFGLSYTAVHKDKRVRNIVSIAAPVDSHQMGILAWLMRVGGGQIDFLARRVGNVPGALSATMFRLLMPHKNITRYGDLFLNMWNREYVNGFDAMNEWLRQIADYPQEAFLQFVNDFMRRNRLLRGKMSFGGKVADLKQVKSSFLCVAGKTDQIATPGAVRAALGAVGSTDKKYLEAPGGHMGVFAGSTAPKHVWGPSADWLDERSGSKEKR